MSIDTARSFVRTIIDPLRTKKGRTKKDTTKKDATKKDATKKVAMKRDETKKDAMKKNATNRKCNEERCFLRTRRLGGDYCVSSRSLFVPKSLFI